MAAEEIPEVKPSAKNQDSESLEESNDHHHYGTILFVILLIVMSFVFAYLQMQDLGNDTSSDEAPVTPTSTPENPTPTPITYGYVPDSNYNTLTIAKRELNPSGTLELFIAEPTDVTQTPATCQFGVVEVSSDQEIVFFQDNKGICDTGLGGWYIHNQLLWGWLDDDTYVLQKEPGTLTGYSSDGTNETTIQVDPSQYIILQGNADGTVWFARASKITEVTNGTVSTVDTDDYSIYFLDQDGNILTTHNINERSNNTIIRDYAYDHVNGGFIVITEFDVTPPTVGTASDRYYRATWFDESLLEAQLIREIGPGPFGGGRGCEIGEFSFGPDLVTYSGLSCFILPDRVGANDILTFELP